MVTVKLIKNLMRKGRYNKRITQPAEEIKLIEVKDGQIVKIGKNIKKKIKDDH